MSGFGHITKNIVSRDRFGSADREFRVGTSSSVIVHPGVLVSGNVAKAGLA